MGLWSIVKNSFKEPSIRKKILMTLLLILIFRVGCFIPVPGLASNALDSLSNNGIFQFMDLLTGGAMSNVSLFAMGISPYINASIIIQLLTVAIPAFEKWQKEGPEGQKRLQKITQFTSVGLALFQAIMLFINMGGFKSSTYSTTGTFTPDFGSGFMGKMFIFLLVILSFVAGTSFLTWLGDKITEVGIGNGISMLIFAGIVARAPSWIGNIISIAVTGNAAETDSDGAAITVAEKLYVSIPFAVIVLAVFAAVVIASVWMETGERRLGVVYAQRVVGRKIMGGQKSYIPLKVNSAGVLPIIFAMSLLQFPLTIAQLINSSGKAATALNSFTNTWWYILIYAVLIVGFTFFYNMVYFDPKEYANNIINNGGQLTEIKTSNRKTTAEYIKKIQHRLTWFGSMFLAVLATLPSILGKICGYIPVIQNTDSLELWLGGTSILILVGVAMELINTLEAELMMRHYKGGKGGFLS